MEYKINLKKIILLNETHNDTYTYQNWPRVYPDQCNAARFPCAGVSNQIHLESFDYR